ncbi:MAG: hypothetical protein LC808_24865 [Actinobacteria bacterium]|nr:hypothetical protein [Actinomycetota bacterium]
MNIQDGYVLRVTARCLRDDLGVSELPLERAVEDIDNELVRAFIDKRGASPVGREKVQPLNSRIEVYSLHAGRWRGATWHDRKNGVVWLLGAKMHRSGDRDDSYPYFKNLDAGRRLVPVQEDYEAFFRFVEPTFVRALETEAPLLLSKSSENPGETVRGTIGHTVDVRLRIEPLDYELEIVVLEVGMDLRAGGLRPPAEWLVLLLAAFFPWEGDLGDVQMAVDAEASAGWREFRSLRERR